MFCPRCRPWHGPGTRALVQPYLRPFPPSPRKRTQSSGGTLAPGPVSASAAIRRPCPSGPGGSTHANPDGAPAHTRICTLNSKVWGRGFCLSRACNQGTLRCGCLSHAAQCPSERPRDRPGLRAPRDPVLHPFVCSIGPGGTWDQGTGHCDVFRPHPMLGGRSGPPHLPP